MISHFSRVFWLFIMLRKIFHRNWIVFPINNGQLPDGNSYTGSMRTDWRQLRATHSVHCLISRPNPRPLDLSSHLLLWLLIKKAVPNKLRFIVRAVGLDSGKSGSHPSWFNGLIFYRAHDLTHIINSRPTTGETK